MMNPLSKRCSKLNMVIKDHDCGPVQQRVIIMNDEKEKEGCKCPYCDVPLDSKPPFCKPC